MLFRSNAAGQPHTLGLLRCWALGGHCIQQAQQGLQLSLPLCGCEQARVAKHHHRQQTTQLLCQVAQAIGHTFGMTARGYVRDLEVAPGCVTLAVIHDLRKLRAGERSEPRCPVSLLEENRAFRRKRMSACARLKGGNARDEKELSANCGKCRTQRLTEEERRGSQRMQRN